ncbi:MAG TPA: hypothetical protein VJR23_14380 [Candidatus Acidoferrales bacterium]|nr:hypothetical protein [Candidatus Acidoferrales bacterium]
MDEELNNIIVFAVFAACLIIVIVGYMLAWRSKGRRFGVVGLVVAAVVMGFAGLLMLAWTMGAMLPFSPTDRSSIWDPVLFVLINSPLILGAFYMAAKFLLRAIKANNNTLNPE